MKYFLFCLICLFAINSMTCMPPKEETKITTSISGFIFDESSKKAISGAIVTTEPATEQVSAGKDGQFKIETNIEIGQTYRVNATASGYQQNFASVNVKEGENKLADISLKKMEGLTVNKEILDFGGIEDSLTLILANDGEGKINYTLTYPDDDWLIIKDPKNGTIDKQGRTIIVKVNRTGLEINTYSAELVITSDSGQKTVQISMEVLGENQPRISMDPLKLNFSESEKTKNFTIKNIGTGTLTFEIVTNETWISVDNKSGELTSGKNVSISVTISAENQGGNGTITVKSNNKNINIPVQTAKANNSETPDVTATQAGNPYPEPTATQTSQTNSDLNLVLKEVKIIRTEYHGDSLNSDYDINPGDNVYFNLILENQGGDLIKSKIRTPEVSTDSAHIDKALGIMRTGQITAINITDQKNMIVGDDLTFIKVLDSAPKGVDIEFKLTIKVNDYPNPDLKQVIPFKLSVK